MKRSNNLLYRVFVFVLFIGSIPIQCLIGLLIMLTSGLPVLFRQVRVGRNGKPFLLYKFRTMTVGAHTRQASYSSYNEADGPVFKIHDDPRFTQFGKFINHTGLDELPQLWNVFFGDMALFGPRPLPVAEEKKLKKWQRAREAIKPGIISPWIFEGYHSKSFEEWMKSDIAYAKEKSLVGDCLLFGKTILFMCKIFFREIIESFA